jgi:hypothetical protein
MDTVLLKWLREVLSHQTPDESVPLPDGREAMVRLTDEEDGVILEVYEDEEGGGPGGPKYLSVVRFIPDWSEPEPTMASRRTVAMDNVFSPRPGDSLKVDPLGDDKFHVEGMLDGVQINGTAITHRGGGLEYVPDEGMPEIDHDQPDPISGAYDTLCDVMGDADPSWVESLEL